MRDSPTIRVVPLDPSRHSTLLGLRLLPAQRHDVGHIRDLLADAASCPQSEPLVILRGECAVGYCRIEPNARSVAGHDFALPALGLRAFFIDAAWQRQGCGGQALVALVAYLAEHRPQARLLVLCVSRSNHAAQRLYRRAGFTDGGELYHDGRSGVQHLLLRTLP